MRYNRSQIKELAIKTKLYLIPLTNFEKVEIKKRFVFVETNSKTVLKFAVCKLVLVLKEGAV